MHEFLRKSARKFTYHLIIISTKIGPFSIGTIHFIFCITFILTVLFKIINLLFTYHYIFMTLINATYYLTSIKHLIIIKCEGPI